MAPKIVQPEKPAHKGVQFGGRTIIIHGMLPRRQRKRQWPNLLRYVLWYSWVTVQSPINDKLGDVLALNIYWYMEIHDYFWLFGDDFIILNKLRTKHIYMLYYLVSFVFILVLLFPYLISKIIEELISKCNKFVKNFIKLKKLILIFSLPSLFRETDLQNNKSAILLYALHQTDGMFTAWHI